MRTWLTINSFIENKKAGVSLQGHSGQKTSFSGTAIHGEPSRARAWLPSALTPHEVKQSGHAILTVKTARGGNEKYLITLRESA